MKNYIPTLLCSLLIVSSGYGQEAANPRAEGAARRAALLKRFPESDTNGDGELSIQELVAHVKKQQASPEGKARLKQMLQRFPKADANGDGEMSLEEWQKFRAAAQKNNTLKPRRNVPQRVVAPVPDVAYGEHKLQRFDLWPIADATEPTPLVIFIHGGGFRGGDKSLVSAQTIEKYREAGIAFAAMNYRLSDSGPYPIMMHDAARGLQTIRQRAKEWNIDPERVVCYGGSAGAGISLWLAFHDDLSDPKSDDPIARQSTRILAAGSMNGQSAYDMHIYREWFGIPDLKMGPALPAFLGIEGEADLDKPAIRAKMKDASPITHLSDDDQAAVYMFYGRPNTKVTKETPSQIWVHHVHLGLKLREAMEKLGLECIVTAPDVPAKTDRYESLEDFLIAKAQGETADN